MPAKKTNNNNKPVVAKTSISSSSTSNNSKNNVSINIPFALFHTLSIILFNYACLILVCFLLNVDLVQLTGLPSAYICGGLKCPTIDSSSSSSSSSLFPTFSRQLLDDAAKVTSKCPITFFVSAAALPIYFNIGLLLIFAFQHTAMARELYKKIATSICYHDRIERSVYIFASDVAVLLLCFAWIPLGDDGKNNNNNNAASSFVFSWTSCRTLWMMGMQILGVFLLVYSMMTFKGLLGSEKAWYGIDAEKESDGVIVTESAHGIIRHPMMVGLMCSLIPSPFYEYTLSRYLFVGSLCLYVIVAVVFFEEPDLMKKVKGYKKYAETVKYRFVPGVL